MQKKDIDWSSLGFGYVKTDKRFVAHYKTASGTKVSLLRMILLHLTNVLVYFSMHKLALRVLSIYN